VKWKILKNASTLDPISTLWKWSYFTNDKMSFTF